MVVYKLDRISRSLRDFMDLSRIFEEHNVSLVSVTQKFDTSTSMGRMMLNMLNMLMTFAQFEREMTADRIRDKMAATRKKGMWRVARGSDPNGVVRVVGLCEIMV